MPSDGIFASRPKKTVKMTIVQQRLDDRPGGARATVCLYRTLTSRDEEIEQLPVMPQFRSTGRQPGLASITVWTRWRGRPGPAGAARAAGGCPEASLGGCVVASGITGTSNGMFSTPQPVPPASAGAARQRQRRPGPGRGARCRCRGNPTIISLGRTSRQHDTEGMAWRLLLVRGV